MGQDSVCQTVCHCVWTQNLCTITQCDRRRMFCVSFAQVFWNLLQRHQVVRAPDFSTSIRAASFLSFIYWIGVQYIKIQMTNKGILEKGTYALKEN